MMTIHADSLTSVGLQGSKVLLVEDEQDIQDLICLHLKRAGFLVDTVGDGEDAVDLINKNSYELLILDWMLPGMSGLKIAKMVREKSNAQGVPNDVPVLMVTAKADSRDIVAGLESGADDYLTKPFEIQVLIARVKALLRRANKVLPPTSGGPSDGEITFGPFRIVAENYDAFNGKERMQLTKSEFKLLLALAQNQGKVLTRDRLIEMVQGDDVAVTTRTIDTHVFGLRKKLGEYSMLIETIRGVGYRIPIMA